MFKPHVVQYLVQSLRRAAESHVTRNADYASCKKALLAAEEATVAARGEAQCELETQSAAHQSTLENAEAAHRIALANMEAQLAQVRVDSSREAGVAQEEIQRLEGELLSQKAAHEAEIREQATMHASVTIVLQVELMETKRHLEQEKSKALEEFKRLTTRCAELEATNKELMRKFEEQSNERVERTNDQEEQSSSAQTSLTIRVPVPSSSRSPIAAGSKRTIEQSTEDPARPQEFLQTTNEPSLPSRRALDLAKLPEIHADLSASNGTPEFFTRESISATLGGNARYRLHIYVANPTSLSVKHDIKWYLCLTVSKLGWLPSGPGKHGFLHMELDQKVTKTDGSSAGNIDNTQLHLFVGIGAGSPEIFQYYGMYRITDAPVLSPEEWEALPAEVSHRRYRLPIRIC
ncbi:hypothetical protein L226DRAFT_243551 [Lentinus tigrinus ALCF2SS1-7]|uniref:uncharacterized protein n=1 Tax=Lentinus tigrinus ALCF2SS1-7 TaxID=1328758 RepID=UPI001165F5E4|nr:hypothetical protein L226DRAFT_243551 [Lentinus tigrinus ALCF2SS1-7]